jgi:hypothetical protein
MLGSDAENPGPGRDTRRTDPDPAAKTDADNAVITAMSDADHDRTRLGSHEYVHARQ